ncbi:hypothetical protein D3C76_1601970 [compost metagenome]
MGPRKAKIRVGHSTDGILTGPADGGVKQRGPQLLQPVKGQQPADIRQPGNMVVQGGRADLQLLGQRSQGQRLNPLLIDHADRSLQNQVRL